MAGSEGKKIIRCSFCGKPQSLAKRMVAGSNAYICDECILMCMDVQVPGRGL